jgi:hypothetical protein
VTGHVKRLITECYGLFRIILGVSQLIGLFFAYFLLEKILKYPDQAVVFAIDADMIALIYLAVIIRGCFHLFAGIGILRESHWLNWWLRAGWFFLLLINTGLVQTFYIEWRQDGYISNIGQIISVPGIIIVLIWMLCDLFFLPNFIKDKEPGPMRINGVSGIVIAAVVFFSLLFFFGRSVKQGFHPGFYKVRTADVISEKGSDGKASALISGESEDILANEPLGDKVYRSGANNVTTGIKREDAVNVASREIKTVKDIMAESKEIPYSLFLVIIAALSFIIGISLHVYNIWQKQEASIWTWNSLLLLEFGILLLVVYGLSTSNILLLLFGIVIFFLISIICGIKLTISTGEEPDNV